MNLMRKKGNAMPYLKLTTNTPLNDSDSDELFNQLSQLIALETGKPENYVLVELNQNRHMLFAGNKDPLAYLECKSIGLTTNQTTSISKSISECLEKLLNIERTRIYIEFSDCPGEYWGWNGATFR